MDIQIKNHNIKVAPLILTIIFEIILIVAYIYYFGAVLSPYSYFVSSFDEFLANFIEGFIALGISGWSVLALMALILGKSFYDSALYLMYDEKDII